MAETWYWKSGTGAACGPGTRRPLEQTAGASAATQDLASEHTWNRVESARTIAAGNWSVFADITTGSGGGPANKVTIVIERRNGSCVVQQTIGTVEVTTTKGATSEFTFNFGDPGQVVFAADDILTCRIVKTAGNQAVTLRFNGAAAGDADTRLVQPEASVAVEGDLAATEGADSVASDGEVEWSADLAATEAADSAAADGEVEWSLSLAATEASDIAAFDGEVTLTPVEGDLAATEGADSFSSNGDVEWSLALAATEGADSGAGDGTVEWIAALAATEGADTAAFDGTSAGRIVRVAQTIRIGIG